MRHPAQLALALLGLTLGVGTIVAVDIATASADRAFELSLGAVNGAATHQMSGGPQGIDEALYVKLRTQPLVPGLPQPALAPLVSGYVRSAGSCCSWSASIRSASAGAAKGRRRTAPAALPACRRRAAGSPSPGHCL